MLVTAGLGFLFSAAVAHAACDARAAHPLTDAMRVRISPFGADRHDVPLSDHGRCGGAARTERVMDWLPVHRGHKARTAAAHLAFSNRVHDNRLEHQRRADASAANR